MLKPFPQPIMEACYKATNEHYAEQAAKDAHFKKALDSVNAFRKEQLRWLQIAEHAIDSFMLSTRGGLSQPRSLSPRTRLRPELVEGRPHSHCVVRQLTTGWGAGR